jgi:ABC-type multidrug transport system ATPase subunit
MSEKFNTLQAAMASSERIFQLLDTEVAVKTPVESKVRSPKSKGHIVFEDVSFAYKDDDYVLRNVSFEMTPGERVAIVGATGAGKSTLISLLLRFYDVSGGRILIDGVDIREMDLAQLRKMFGLVLQDVHLFSGTIAGNIRLGDDSIDDARVHEAARAVHAHRFIESLPGGYHARVAERGATLSVGQKQLLSFARALAFDPSVLILDEATSRVDTETEMLIRDALRVLMSGRTTLAIAHRLSTIQDMDKILVFHKGKLARRGQSPAAAGDARDLLQAVSASSKGGPPSLVEAAYRRRASARLAGFVTPTVALRRRSRLGFLERRIRQRRDAPVGNALRARLSWRLGLLRFVVRPHVRNAPVKERLHQRRSVFGIPAQTKYNDVHILPSESQCVEAAPHVHIELVALHFRARVHDGIDAVVLIRFEVGLNHRSHRQRLRIGSGDAAASGHTRGGRISLAVCGGLELQAGARIGRRVPLQQFGLARSVARVRDGSFVQQHEGCHQHHAGKCAPPEIPSHAKCSNPAGSSSVLPLRCRSIARSAVRRPMRVTGRPPASRIAFFRRERILGDTANRSS